MRKDTPTRAREHAHLAAAQSKMKGIPATDAGVALMAQGLAMVYEIPLLHALETVPILIQAAHDQILNGITAAARGCATGPEKGPQDLSQLPRPVFSREK